MLQRTPTVVRSDVAEISLGNGRVAVVDLADLPLVEARKWRAQPGKGTTLYAASAGTLMHRVILGLPKGMFVDHIDGDGLNNRRSNLRLCNNAQNTQNQRKRSGLSSRFKGVHRTKEGHWGAAIEKNGRSVYLGVYAQEELAAKQYDRAARLMFGQFAKTNEMLGLLPASAA